MPRYFFDVRDQHGVLYDEIGLELPDLDAARREAWRALGDMMQETIAATGKAAITIDIRGSSGKFVVEVVAASDDRNRS